jgi:hypothetical protein
MYWLVFIVCVGLECEQPKLAASYDNLKACEDAALAVGESGRVAICYPAPEEEKDD